MSGDERFVWPTPPYYEYVSSADGLLPRGCLVVGSDGRGRSGRLVHFDVANAQLGIEAADRSAVENLPFSEVRKLQLIRPVRMIPRELAKLAVAEQATESGSQAIRISLKGGERFESQTRGFQIERAGIFCYLVVDNARVLRTFFPAQSYDDYSIGPSLGEMIADQATDTVDFVAAGLQLQNELRSQRIGDYLTSSQIISRELLEQVLKNRDASAPEIMLGETLLREKLVSQDQLDAAVKLQRRDRKLPLGELLVEMGVIDRATVNRLLVRKLGIPFVDPTRFQIDPDIFNLVERRLAEKHHVMPLFRTRDEIIVAMENPTDPEPTHELRFFTKLRVVPVMADRDSIFAAIRTHYGQLEVSRNVRALAFAASAEAEAESRELAVSDSDNALVKLVNQIIVDARERGASDIHIEAYPGHQDTRVVFRIDGELEPYLDVPARFRAALVSRLKIMSNLDISEHRKPQDGKIVFDRGESEKLELRVAVMPTAAGLEDVVMRVLASAKPIPLDSIGLRDTALEQAKRIAAMPYGLFLICGPTGSGKTTTLHSVLSHINNGKKKIWTAEDPIEITQVGLRQVQVNARIGLTFSAALRSFLRLDPDVIMVGEMRDAETARTGIEASLTGHLVLSTLHTNSASESITRLLDLGLDPFNFADGLLGVLAQRLARKLCTDCRKSVVLDGDALEALLSEYREGTSLDREQVRERLSSRYADKRGRLVRFDAVGCDKCGGRGFRGRLGVHELLVNSRPIKRLIQSHGKVEEIQAQAMQEGMLTLKQDGIEKVLQGLTDLEQVRSLAI